MAESDSYQAVVDEARLAPEVFWRRAAAGISWIKPFDTVLDRSAAPLQRWYPGGVLNTCYNAIDCHVERGRADQPAVIYDSPVTGVKRTLTYRQLRDEVAHFAGVLASHGVAKCDRVVECAVFGVKDALKTQIPLALIVLKATVEREHCVIKQELIDLVRREVGPVANLKQVGIVARLPKTRSGKVMRSTMRKIANAEAFQIPATIEDPSVLGDIRAALQELGYAG